MQLIPDPLQTLPIHRRFSFSVVSRDEVLHSHIGSESGDVFEKAEQLLTLRNCFYWKSITLTDICSCLLPKCGGLLYALGGITASRKHGDTPASKTHGDMRRPQTVICRRRDPSLEEGIDLRRDAHANRDDTNDNITASMWCVQVYFNKVRYSPERHFRVCFKACMLRFQAWISTSVANICSRGIFF